MRSCQPWHGAQVISHAKISESPLRKPSVRSKLKCPLCENPLRHPLRKPSASAKTLCENPLAKRDSDEYDAPRARRAGDPGQYSRISSGAARRIWNMRKSTSIILSVLLLAIGFCHLAQAAGPADRFKALGPDKSQATKDSLFYPNDFEAAAARHPDPNGLVFFSLCRRAPFTSTTLYSPFSSGNVDAIVGDTTFPLVDGTQCYEPQNEQNIVVNPTNSQNIVTTANDYRYGFQALIYYSTD